MIPTLKHFFQLLQMDIKFFLTDVSAFFKKPPTWAIVIFAVCLYFSPLPLFMLYFGILGSIEYTYPLYQPADAITEICLVEFQDETYLYSHSKDEISILLENSGTKAVAIDHKVISKLSPAVNGSMTRIPVSIPERFLSNMLMVPVNGSPPMEHSSTVRTRRTVP